MLTIYISGAILTFCVFIFEALKGKFVQRGADYLEQLGLPPALTILLILCYSTGGAVWWPIVVPIVIALRIHVNSKQ